MALTPACYSRTVEAIVPPIANGAPRRCRGGSRSVGRGCLDPQFRRQMESAFETDFRDVLVDRSPMANRITAGLGTIAAASDCCIYLSTDLDGCDAALRETVLAHELAHIVQKRRGRASMTQSIARDLLEAEAHIAARRAVRTGRAPIVLGDPSPRLSAWGPAGHYYTTLFALWAAGIEEKRARDIAFFCQMPDQVFEFDAISAVIDHHACNMLNECAGGTLAGFNYATPSYVAGREANPDMTFTPATYRDRLVYLAPAAPGGYGPVMAPGTVVTVHEEVTQAHFSYSTYAVQRQIDRDVAEGLHSLTGGFALKETKFRESKLFECVDDIELGLALHAYGDCFAHREMVDQRIMNLFDIGHAKHGHSSDKIGLRMDLFHLYAATLYGLIRKREGHPTAKLNYGHMIKVLDKVWPPATMPALTDTGDGNDKMECRKFREMILCSVNAPSFETDVSYAPEDTDEMYWCDFKRSEPARKIFERQPVRSDTVFRIARKKGELWNKQRHQQGLLQEQHD
jgi:hypothetical protein